MQVSCLPNNMYIYSGHVLALIPCDVRVCTCSVQVLYKEGETVRDSRRPHYLYIGGGEHTLRSVRQKEPHFFFTCTWMIFFFPTFFSPFAFPTYMLVTYIYIYTFNVWQSRMHTHVSPFLYLTLLSSGGAGGLEIMRRGKKRGEKKGR